MKQNENTNHQPLSLNKKTVGKFYNATRIAAKGGLYAAVVTQTTGVTLQTMGTMQGIDLQKITEIILLTSSFR